VARRRPDVRRPSRRRFVVRVAAAAIVVAAIAAWGLSHRSASGSAPGFDVILVTMDTTRADHLGCYGGTARTPNLDDLARTGTLFGRCEAAAPITLPSHASLFTGTDPYVHGARNNGSYFLRDENVTLPELLSKVGYATAGVVGSFILNRETGMNQGFDLYDDIYSSPASWRPDAAANGAQRFERRADEVCDHALAWLQAHAHERFFLWVHFYDAHFPYEPPARFRQPGASLYDGEIAFVDEQIGRLRDAVRRASIDSRTVFVVTADHGESLGQHDEETHSYTVYESALHVPLIFHAPGAVPAGRRLDETVASVDVVPTLLELLDLPKKPDAQGVSLLPLILRETSAFDAPAYASTIAPYDEFGFSMVRCLVRDEWKYIHAPRPELYDLADDPNEIHNLADVRPSLVQELREEMRERIASAPRPAPASASTVPLDDETTRALDALGYVAGSGPAPSRPEDELEFFEPRGPDPKDHMAEVRTLSHAIRDIDLGRYASAESALRGLLRGASTASASFATCHERLAYVLLMQQKYAEAVEHYRIALACNPDDDHDHNDLGAALLRLGKFDEAMEHFQAALKLSPTNATSHANVGRGFLRLGKVDEAIEELRAALRIRPVYFELYPTLAEALRSRGRVPEALAVVEDSTKVDPDNTIVLQRAAVSFVSMHEYGRAIDLLRSAVGRLPQNVDLDAALARLLATAPDAAQRNGAEAVRLAERAAKAAGEPGDPGVFQALAVAYAETGRFDDAIRAANRALPLLVARGQEPFAEQLRAQIGAFERGEPYHDAP
jgi:arylsulfatase A-like enzyme/Flp pilus assembly protein TadD